MRNLALAGVGLLERAIARLRRQVMGGQAQLAPTAVLHPTARLIPLDGDARSIRLGEHTHLRGELLIAAHGGRIEIGDWCYIGEGTRIWSGASVTIGDRVLISHNCDIHDWDAHPLAAEERHAQFREIILRGHPGDQGSVAAAPIVIGSDAWIGFGCTLLKGITVGERSVIAARSLVTKDVPPGVLVAGAPAQIVKSL
jgi:acetyltransferase-like isoleucine patch superfamily enzyme